MPRRRVILVGIGGSSASGKSTLAGGLAKEFNSPLRVFSADHYLDISRVRAAGSWETPAGIAWDDLRAALENVITTLAESERLPPSLVVGGFSRGPLELVPQGQGGKLLGSESVVVFIEGFLLFSDKKLCEMLDLALWIETDCDTCGQRRFDREGQRGPFEKYMQRFRQEVWHHYELYRCEQLANVPKVLRLDGALEPQTLNIEATRYCKAAVKSDIQEATIMSTSSNETASLQEITVPVRRPVILVGIGGSSASGKSTVAAGLVKELDSPLKVFSADHYLDFNRVRRAGSWETPAGIAWDELRAALEKVATMLAESEVLPPSVAVGGFSRGILELVPKGNGGKPLGPEPVVIVIEGFLLFCDQKLCDMLDVSLWLDSDCNTCARRRYNREGQPGDFEQYSEGFREEVWHHYELYRGAQLANVPKVLQLDSALEPQSVISQAVVHCSASLKSTAQEESPESALTPEGNGSPLELLVEEASKATVSTQKPGVLSKIAECLCCART